MRRAVVGTAAASAWLLLGTLTGCGDQGAASCPDPTAMPAAARPTVGGTIRVERLGTVVAGQEAEAFATMTIESDLSIDEEGFESEIYVGGPESATALAKVTESTECERRTTIVLTVSDPRLTVASG